MRKSLSKDRDKGGALQIKSEKCTAYFRVGFKKRCPSSSSRLRSGFFFLYLSPQSGLVQGALIVDLPRGTVLPTRDPARCKKKIRANMHPNSNFQLAYWTSTSTGRPRYGKIIPHTHPHFHPGNGFVPYWLRAWESSADPSTTKQVVSG